MIKRKHLSYFSILFTFFVDNLGWSIVFPIFAPLFLDPHQVFFSAATGIDTKTTLLGIFLAASPLAQFFGAPLLGDLADHYGRKKAFLLSIFLTLIGYSLSAFSIEIKSLSLLFFSRIISGFFSGNLSLCLAAIGDIHPTFQKKVEKIGFLSFFGGFSFIIGAYLGGKLSDSTIVSFFSYSFPLWIAALLSFFNILFLFFWFTETRIFEIRVPFHLAESFKNIISALKVKKIKIAYLIYFLFVFSWTMLFQFTPVLVVHNYHFTSSGLGDFAAFMGVAWALGSLLNHFLSRFLTLVLESSLFLFAVFCIGVVLSHQLFFVMLFVLLSFVLGGLAWPFYTGVISSLAPHEIQGKILGISQSMQSLGMTLAPIVGGLGNILFFRVPFLLAACSAIVAAILFFSLRTNR